MDLLPLFSSAFSILIPFFIVFVLFTALGAYFRSSSFKGKLGESFVNNFAKAMLDKKTYYLLQNVTLKDGGGTTQIDHIIVSKYGVFVIETKTMKGWIFGEEQHKTWTQVLFKDKYTFQNPLRQNYKHVKAVQDLLKINDDQIHSVVAFMGESTFKTAMPDNVTQGLDYIDYIKSKKKPVLTGEEVEIIKIKLESYRLENSRQTDKAHIEHVKRLHDKS